MSHPVTGQITNMNGTKAVYIATLEHLHKKGVHPPREKASIGIQLANTQVYSSSTDTISLSFTAFLPVELGLHVHAEQTPPCSIKPQLWFADLRTRALTIGQGR